MMAVAASSKERRAHFTYIWKIESAPRYSTFKSPVFTVQLMEMTKWCLVMDINESVMKLYIERAKEDGGPEVIEAEFELSILDTNGSLLIMSSVTKHFRKEERSKDLGFSETDALFDKRSNELLFPKNPLIFRCRIWRTRTEIIKSEMCFASTRFDVHKLSCIWAIKKISSLQQGEKRIRILNSTEKECPQLILDLSLAERGNKKYVVIHLEEPHLQNCLEIEAEIAVLDAEGITILNDETSTYLDIDEKRREISVFEKSKLISDGAVLSDDVLVLRCELQVISHVPVYNRIEDYKLMDYSDLERAHREKSEVRFDELSEAAVCPFKEIVNKFKEDGTLSDICLRSGTNSFPAHKLVLSSRSPVFRAMFTKDMREKKSNCVDIPDLDADTLNRLLLYIYENKIQELPWEAAANLFKAADKYELLSLKDICSCILKTNLSKSNVCEILVLADMHHDESLKKSVEEFILNNSEIVYSDVWKLFREDHSKLALETAEQIIYNLKNSRS